MTQTRRRNPWLVAAGAAALAVSLGGSYCTDRGYYTPGVLNQGAAQTTEGPVGGFGSIFVDGTEFTDSSATVTVDGVAATESDLKVGQIATLAGAVPSSGTASASAVAVTTKLVGQVGAVNLPAGTVTVLGQTVQISGDTSIADGVAPTDPSGIAVGDLVAVDGYRIATGVLATRFDRATSATEYRATGIVSALTGASQTFALGGTTVDYSGVSSGLPSGLTTGSYVIVTGSAGADAATLMASRIQVVAEATAGASGASGNLHGAITRFASTSDFDVAGQPATSTASTTFSGGTAADLGADVEVEITGQYASSGTLSATTIEVFPRADVRVVGPVSAVDSTAATATVAGVTISTTTETRWDDRSAAALRTFGLATLNVGDWIEARGVDGSGTLAMTARVLERRTAPASPVVELQDVAAALSSPQFTLTGVVVQTNGATFTDANGQPVSASVFYGEAAGRVVRATGTLSSSGALVARTVALRQ